VEIFTVKPDGSELRQLTTSPGHDTLPLFLPTGEVVFRSVRDGRWGIWKMKADGSDQTLIIANAPVGPDWAHSKMDVLR
jgi:Tol biopolymer transport system component